jgi:hypothetical protein
MKPSSTLPLLLLAVLALASLSAQTALPPGTMQIGENKFLDKRLITYIDYEEFLHFIKDDAPRYQAMIPADTLARYEGRQLWRNPAFREYPIVGLTENQIREYCQWRSEVVNRMIHNPDMRTCNFDYWRGFDLMDPGKALRVTYAIPEKEDLKKAPKKGNKYWLDEIVRDGYAERKKTKKISDPGLKGFRCVAYFEI